MKDDLLVIHKKDGKSLFYNGKHGFTMLDAYDHLFHAHIAGDSVGGLLNAMMADLTLDYSQ
jgi:hypothetical protein